MKKTLELVPEDDPALPLATPRWKKGLVFLCSKCSGQQHGQGAPDEMPSWDTWKLRCWLKDRMLAEGLWPDVRVLTTSCLGICQPGSITCTLGGDTAGADGDQRCVVVDPERDHEALLDLIRRSVEPDEAPPAGA